MFARADAVDFWNCRGGFDEFAKGHAEGLGDAEGNAECRTCPFRSIWLSMLRLTSERLASC